MKTSFTFLNDKLAQAERDFTKIRFTADQLKIVEGVTKILCSFIDMSDLAMKGFISYGIKEWQQDKSITIAELAKASPDVRLKHMKDLFSILSKKLKSSLASKSQETNIEGIVEKAFEFYKENFAFR